MAEKWGIENLELDGNYQNNTRPFDENDDAWDTAAMGGWLQNSGDWAGFHTNGAGNQEYANGAEFHLSRVHIHGIGGNGIATNPQGPKIIADNVAVGNSVRNHSIYHFNSSEQIKNIKTYGYQWSPPMKLGSKDDNVTTYDGVTFEDLIENPEGYRQQMVFNIIGGNTTIKNASIDLRGSYSGITTMVFMTASRPNISMRDFEVWTGDNGLQLYDFRATPPDVMTFENWTINSNGTGVSIISSQQDDSFLVKDVTVEEGNSASGAATDRIFQRAQSAKYDNLSRPSRFDVVNLQYTRPLDGVMFKGGGGPDNVSNSLPRGLFIRDSSFPAGADFFDDDGRWSAFGDTDDNFRDQRIYLDNTTIDLPASWVYPFGNNTDRGPDRHGIGSAEETTATFMLRDVEDHSGHVSDQTGTFTSDASDEGNDYVLIPTNLLYRAWGRSATVTSGNRTVQSVEVANSNGTLRGTARGVGQREPYLKVNLDAAIQAGNTIAVDWEAHVTPLDEYQTTGVFVSRPVYDRTSGSHKGTLTSGNGPFMFDLRGVVVSQESKDVVSYSASSGNTSVVTANVQSDDYTLELTEQGTGTATITVTGEIPGVGSATDTFEVTIE
jgi:hypothetical protein